MTSAPRQREVRITVHIDPALEQQIQRDHNKAVDVVIICPQYSSEIGTNLEQVGFQAKSLEQAKHGFLYGRLRLSDLANIQNDPGLESIELDSTQYALNG